MLTFAILFIFAAIALLAFHIILFVRGEKSPFSARLADAYFPFIGAMIFLLLLLGITNLKSYYYD